MPRTSFFSRDFRKSRAANKNRDLWRPRLERLEARDVPSIAYSIAATGNTLLRFDTSNPSATTDVAITGLLSGEILDSIAFRTQTNQLFGVAFNSSTQTARLGTINVSNGVFYVINGSFPVSSAVGLTLSDDPVNDRLHLVTDSGESLMINPNDASVTPVSNVAEGNDLAGLAFNNDFKGSTATSSFAIDASTDQLVVVDLSTGAVTPVGVNLGVGPISGVGGFTVETDGTALAVLEVSGQSNLYSINLTLGTATLMGQISPNATVAAGLAIAPLSMEVTSSGPGMAATVQVYNADGSLKMNLHPFEGYTGGVTAAFADVNGDGIPDIIVGAGYGGGPRVTVYNGTNGATLANFFAYDLTFTGGVFVAGGDVNGDGKADIITGAGLGGGPHVKVIDGTKLNQVQLLTGEISDSALLASYMAYSITFSGGVRVAAGDLDLVGGLGVPFHDEVITAAGTTGGPHVKVFNGFGGTPWTGGINSFFAYDSTFTGGVFVAAADVNGDGKADIIVGAGAQNEPQVKVFNAADLGLLLMLDPFSTTFNGGVRVGVDDVNGTGQTDIVVAGGPGQPSTVVAFNTTTKAQVSSVTAFDPTFLGGVFVGGIL